MAIEIGINAYLSPKNNTDARCWCVDVQPYWCL